MKLLAAMMVVVSVITAVGLYVEQRNLAAEVAIELQSQFQGELTSLHNAQEVRHAALAERCRTLVRKPRIHAALEDNALDLLYPSAKEELADALAVREATDNPATGHSIRPRFYRFLDSSGAVIPPVSAPEVGALSPDEE